MGQDAKQGEGRRVSKEVDQGVEGGKFDHWIDARANLALGLIIMGSASARFSEIFIKEGTSVRVGLGVIVLLPAIGKNKKEKRKGTEGQELSQI